MKTKYGLFLMIAGIFTLQTPTHSNTVTVVAVSLSMTTTPPLVQLTKPVWKGREFSFSYYSDAFTSIKSTLKVSSLTAPEYDIYSSGNFVGSWTGAQLAAGVPVPVGSGIIDADIRMILNAMDAPMKNAAAKMMAAQQKYSLWPEYDGMSKWISRMLTQDRSGRLANILIAEKGLPTSLRPPIDLTTDERVKARSLDLVADMERLRRVVLENKFNEALQAEYLGYLAPINVSIRNDNDGATIVSFTNLYPTLFWAEVTVVQNGKPLAGKTACKVHIDSGLSQTCKFGKEIPADADMIVKGKYGPYRFTAIYPVAGFR